MAPVRGLELVLDNLSLLDSSYCLYLGISLFSVISCYLYRCWLFWKFVYWNTKRVLLINRCFLEWPIVWHCWVANNNYIWSLPWHTHNLMEELQKTSFQYFVLYVLGETCGGFYESSEERPLTQPEGLIKIKVLLGPVLKNNSELSMGKTKRYLFWA